MAGWMHLPRFIDKIRLHHAAKLPADYQSNFCRGFDGSWLEASGVSKETFLDVVRKAKDDMEVEQWIKTHVKKSPAMIEAFNQKILHYGREGDVAVRLQQRKKEAGLAHRTDIQTFIDLIEVEEGLR